MRQATGEKRQDETRMSHVTCHLSRHGLTAMSTMIIISVVVIEIVITGSLAAYLLSNSNTASKSGSNALTAAQAGLQDAELRIARDKSYPSGGTVQYTVVAGSSTSVVFIERDQPVMGKDRITVTGTAGNFSKKIQAVYSVDGQSGEVAMESYAELPL